MTRNIDSILLTRQELRIMKVIWGKESATVREVCQILSQEKPTAYTTVLTLMTILEQKGALAHFCSGRAYVYRPVLSKDQATRNQVEDVIQRFFDGKAEKLIASVLQNDMTDPMLLESVKDLIESRVA
jgi:BlaI family penicillinase repressor